MKFSSKPFKQYGPGTGALTLVLAGTLLGGLSRADGRSELTAGHAANMIQISPASATGFPTEDVTPPKVTLFVAPHALRHLTRHGSAGQNNWVSVDLDIGAFSGIRAAILPYSDENLSISIEGKIGEAGLTAAYGGGVRVQFRVAASQSNALLISPGLDVMFSPPDSGFFGHSKDMYFVMANADVAWVHEFAPHFGFEVGIRAGGGVRFSDASGTGLVPELELFSGLRF